MIPAVDGAHVGAPEGPVDVEVLAHDGRVQHVVGHLGVAPLPLFIPNGRDLVVGHVLFQNVSPL